MAERLRDAAAEGRLTSEELEERLGRALRRSDPRRARRGGGRPPRAARASEAAGPRHAAGAVRVPVHVRAARGDLGPLGHGLLLARVADPRVGRVRGGSRPRRLPAGSSPPRRPRSSLTRVVPPRVVCAAMPSRLFAPGLLDGQVAIVSGGGSGLGRASALELARAARTWWCAAGALEPLEETVAPRGGRALRGAGLRHPRGGAGERARGRRARAPRPHRPAREQRRRPVPHARPRTSRPRASAP